MKKKNIILIILVIIAILITSIILYNNYSTYKTTYDYKLNKVGYSKEEIVILKSEYTDDILDLLVESKYNNIYVKLPTHKYWIEKNINRYITIIKNNENSPMSTVVSYINVGNDTEFYTSTKEALVSLNELVLVNKHNYMPTLHNLTDKLVKIPLTYAYDNQYVYSVVKDNFVALVKQAKSEGLNIVAHTSYRSYEEQETLYHIQVGKLGENADKVSARPGYSEHESGYAIDIACYGKSLDDFINTLEYNWLLENAYKYGFILRYPEGKENITGYGFEPSHYRYVGVDIATKIYNLNITFDEYYAYYIEK